MIMKKAILNDKMYNLISREEYSSKRDYYNSTNSIAVEYQYDENTTIGLPIVQNRNTTGIFSNGPISYFNVKEDEIENYICNEDNVIDFTNINNMADYYENCIKYNDVEREIITNTINQSKPIIKEDDSPLLKITKQTICDKNIDMDKYADRFENYNNDKRILSNKDITIKKSSLMLENLDVDTYIITTNKDEDVPNPMPKPLIRKISGNGEELSVDELVDLLKGGE